MLLDFLPMSSPFKVCANHSRRAHEANARVVAHKNPGSPLNICCSNDIQRQETSGMFC